MVVGHAQCCTNIKSNGMVTNLCNSRQQIGHRLKWTASPKLGAPAEFCKQKRVPQAVAIAADDQLYAGTLASRDPSSNISTHSIDSPTAAPKSTAGGPLQVAKTA